MKAQTKPIPKGPQGHLITGCADDLKNDPLNFFMRCQAEFGNIVPFKIGTFPALLISDPNMIYEVLVGQSQNFSKDAALKNNREFFGHGLLSSEGEYWKRQRKLSSAAFSPKRLEAYAKVMVDHATGMLNHWQDGMDVEIQHEMMNLTLGIAAKTLFDAELSTDNKELEQALTDAQMHLADRMNDPILLMLPEWVPFPTNIHLHEAIQKVDKVVFKLMEERRGKTEGRNDLLSMFMSVTDDESGQGMTDRQVRDEVFTLFFAGHETTALTLTWTLYLLSQNPEVEEKLLVELKSVLNGRHPSISDYGALKYAEKVVKESMRIRPPVWAIGRETLNDCIIGDYAIPKRMAIIISQWVLHHDKRFYTDPECFNPDRWTDEFTQALPKFAYFPFGGGPRVCIGNGFAMIESVLVLATILQNFRLQSLSNDPVELNPVITLRSKNGIPMKLNKR